MVSFVTRCKWRRGVSAEQATPQQIARPEAFTRLATELHCLELDRKRLENWPKMMRSESKITWLGLALFVLFAAVALS